MKLMVSFCAMTLLSAGVAQAQVELSTYGDAKGNLDVQKLTCAQLANTFQEDADFMTVWYSGWYNGLAGYQQIEGRPRQGVRAPRHCLLQGQSENQGHHGDGHQHQEDAQGTGHQGQRREVTSPRGRSSTDSRRA